MERRLRLVSPLVLLLLVVGGACGGSNDPGGSLDAGPDVAAQSDAAAADTARPPDGAQNDVAPPLDTGSVDTATGPWPPPAPWHSGTACALPACNSAGAETADLTGTWTETLTTVSHTCNALVASMDPRMQTGHVETTPNLTYPRAGECVYLDAVGGTLVGVIKGDVMVFCEVLPAQQGVTPILEFVATFSGGSATGQAWTYLFGVPLPPADCQADYTMTMQRQ